MNEKLYRIKLEVCQGGRVGLLRENFSHCQSLQKHYCTILACIIKASGAPRGWGSQGAIRHLGFGNEYIL